MASIADNASLVWITVALVIGRGLEGRCSVRTPLWISAGLLDANATAGLMKRDDLRFVRLLVSILRLEKVLTDALVERLRRGQSAKQAVVDLRLHHSRLPS